jgi:hypothetical protein
MLFQPVTLQSAAATGYSIVNAQNANSAILPCRAGEFWVRPFPTTATKVLASGANATVTSPITAPITTGWLRMLPGDKATFGDTLSDPISQIDVWSVAASGELDVVQH